jgi:hypothetical protein
VRLAGQPHSVPSPARNAHEPLGTMTGLTITNQALRELSGVNGLLVGDSIKAHADGVINHNSKEGESCKEGFDINIWLSGSRLCIFKPRQCERIV